MTSYEYLDLISKSLVHELGQNSLIRQITTNSEIIGAYAEATIRKLVSEIISPLRVSTGAVIDTDLIPDPKLRQVDAIIWQPCPAPGLLRAEGFALVPRSSSFGVLEIKRSCYTGAKESAEVVLKGACKLVNHFVQAEEQQFMTPHSRCVAGLAVFCLRQKGQTAPRDLIDAGQAVVLMDEEKNETNTDGVCRLLNFLMHVRRIASQHDGQVLAASAERIRASANSAI